jgi:hypothetical protein
LSYKKKKLDETQKSESPPTGDSEGPRIFLNPDEWKEPAGRKVVEEYHKGGIPDSTTGSKFDLESFEQYWKTKGKGKGKVSSGYHKEGAPYMEMPPDLEGHITPIEKTPDKMVEKVTEEEAPVREGLPRIAGTAAGGGKDGEKYEEKGILGTAKVTYSQAQPHIERVIDVATVEVLALAIFRVIFGRGFRLPLKREGLIDMDIVASDKDILLNANKIIFEMPELAIWRFIFAYKGKPVLEYGRGVRRTIKIYYYRMFCLLLAMWLAGWKKKRGRAKSVQGKHDIGTKGKKGADN